LTRPSGTLSPSERERDGVRGRFTESEYLQKIGLELSHEPVGNPLNRPPGTFSSTLGEGQDDGARFMGRFPRNENSRALNPEPMKNIERPTPNPPRALPQAKSGATQVSK